MMPGMPPLPLPGGLDGPPMGGQAPGAGTGPAMMPTPMRGAQIGGAAAVKAAIELLQHSLAGLTLGSDIHTAVLKATSELARHIGAAEKDVSPQDTIAQLVAAAKQAGAGGQPHPMAAMMPGGPPPVPPPAPGGAPPLAA